MSNPEKSIYIEALTIRHQIEAVPVTLNEDFEVFLAYQSVRLAEVRQPSPELFRMFSDRRKRTSVSRPAFSSYYVWSSGRNIIEGAMKEGERGNSDRFAFMFDYAHGVMTISNTIISAEEYLNGGLEELAAGSASDLSLAMNKGDEDIERAVKSGMIRAQVQAELLQEDPSGFTLLGELLKSETGEPTRIPEYGGLLSEVIDDAIVLQGIRGGIDLYHAMYNTVGPLFPIP